MLKPKYELGQTVYLRNNRSAFMLCPNCDKPIDLGKKVIEAVVVFFGLTI